MDSIPKTPRPLSGVLRIKQPVLFKCSGGSEPTPDIGISMEDCSKFPDRRSHRSHPTTLGTERSNGNEDVLTDDVLLRILDNIPRFPHQNLPLRVGVRNLLDFRV